MEEINDLDYSQEQEEQEIVDQARINGTYLKAPNGQDTNLDSKQWVQVRTKAFKEWFGDWENNKDESSKILDVNGEPMVVYHGSLNDFNIFDYGKIRSTRKAGFYFTKNKALAKNYQKEGKLIEAFVNLRKPLNSDETKKEVTKELFVEIANEAGIERDVNKLYDIADSDIDLVSFLISANNDIKAINNALYTVTKYDGIITEDRGLGRSYIVFSPNQIKSAVENVGTFSLKNDDIRFRFIDEKGYVNEKFNEELRRQIISSLHSLSEILHSPIKFIKEENQLSESMREKLQDIHRNGNSIKGWYNVSTGNVEIYLPDVVSVKDAKATFLHEVVGHKGLRGLLGNEFIPFLDRVYETASERTKQEIIELSKNHHSNLHVGTEEYMAKLAERGFSDREDSSSWQKIKNLFTDTLCKLKINLGFKLSDNDLRLILWKSYQCLAGNRQLTFADKDLSFALKNAVLSAKDGLLQPFIALKEQGYKPSKELIQSLETSMPVNTMIAIKKIFGIKAGKEDVKDIRLAQSKPSEKGNSILNPITNTIKLAFSDM